MSRDSSLPYVITEAFAWLSLRNGNFDEMHEATKQRLLKEGYLKHSLLRGYHWSDEIAPVFSAFCQWEWQLREALDKSSR